MNDFLKWFFVFISEILKGFGMIFKGLWEGLKQIFNISEYAKIFKDYSGDFNALEWVFAVLSLIIVAAIFALIIFLIVMLIRKYVRFRHSIVGDEDVIEELGVLQRQVIKLTKRKRRDHGYVGSSDRRSCGSCSTSLRRIWPFSEHGIQSGRSTCGVRTACCR